MIDRKKRALWLNSVYRLTLKTNCKQLLWPDVRWIQEYRHCMLKIALIFISYFNNLCLASELTGSIIHERVDSINYGEQVTSSTVNLLVRWQIKKFNYKSHFIQPFTVQQTTSTRSKKNNHINLTCTLASAKYLLSVYVQPNLTCTWFDCSL